MKKFMFGLLAIALLAVAAITLQSSAPPPPPPPASFSNMWSQAFDLDTLTNSASDNYEFNRAFDYPSDISFKVVDTEISGTATNLVVVQQTLCATCTDAWVSTDTVASITATGTHFINLTQDANLAGENPLWGYRVRLRAVNTGTGVHSMKIYALARVRRS